MKEIKALVRVVLSAGLFVGFIVAVLNLGKVTYELHAGNMGNVLFAVGAGLLVFIFKSVLDFLKRVFGPIEYDED